MFGGGKNREQTQRPEKPQPGFLESLKMNFEFARYGNQCRTLSFRNEDTAEALGTEFLRAMEDPLTRRWHVYRFRRRGADVSCALTESGPFTFFEAVEHLARYEVSQPDFGAAPAGGDEGGDAAALGSSYFRAFAEKEGIVFDLDDLPHPSLHGLVATPGRFPADAEEKLARQARSRPEDSGEPPAAVRLVFEKAAADAGNAVERLVLAYDTAEAFDKFLADVAGLRALMNYYRSGFDNAQKNDYDMARLLGMDYGEFAEARRSWEEGAAKKDAAPPPVSPDDNFSAYCFYWRLARAEKNLADALGDAGTELLGRGLKEQALCFEALRANAFVRRLYANGEDRAEMKRLHALALAGMDRLAGETGCTDYSLHILKTASMSAEPMPLPESVAAFGKSCETLKNNLEATIRTRKEIMSNPPAPPALHYWP